MPAPTPTDAAPPAASGMPVHHIPHAQLWFTRLIQVPLMAAATAFFGTISLICGLWDTSGSQQHLVARAWAGIMLRIARAPVAVIGAQNLPTETAVYAANHLSYMDTPALFAHLPFQFRILAKQGLWKIPFVGWYLARSGQVPIDSSNARSAVAGLLRGVAALRSGMPLVVFPEGSRTPDGALQPMASGAAFMAIRAQVPLVPLALIGTYDLLPIHVYALRPRPCKIVVGEPIATTGLTTRDADALTARLYAAIEVIYLAETDLV